MDLAPWTTESARRWLAARVSPADARDRALAAFDEVRLRGTGVPPVSVPPPTCAGRTCHGIVVAHADNAAYAGAWLAAATTVGAVWCANPKWGETERAEAAALVPDGVWWADDELRIGDCGLRIEHRRTRRQGAPVQSAIRNPQFAILFIPTGGTGGKIRFVRHTPDTLSVAVAGFSRYAGERLLKAGRPARLAAVQALPCCHVSGLMPVVRAWLTDAELVFTPPSFRPDEPLPRMPAGEGALTVVSLVAAQLFRLLERADGPAWLRSAGLVLAGGSAIAPELLERARAERIPLGVSYGLTEAAALAALYPPEAFLRGDVPVAGEVLPHIRVFITPGGRVALAGDSLGADVPRDAEGRYVTGDEGFLDAAGRLVVTGRADRIIVSGGEKVDPVEVEAALRATGLVREVVVVGEPDPEWGRRVVAVYTGDASPETLAAALSGKLAGFRLPRRWVRAEGRLLDEKGKVDGAALKSALLRP